MAGQNVEYFLSVFFASARGNGHAEHGLLALIVHLIFVGEVADRPSPKGDEAGWVRAYSPPRKAARDLDNVFLRLGAIHAECVQFHQFARIVFVQAARFLLTRKMAAPERRTARGAGAVSAAWGGLMLLCQLSR
jgi:hypothetical protein